MMLTHCAFRNEFEHSSMSLLVRHGLVNLLSLKAPPYDALVIGLQYRFSVNGSCITMLPTVFSFDDCFNIKFRVLLPLNSLVQLSVWHKHYTLHSLVLVALLVVITKEITIGSSRNVRYVQANTNETSLNFHQTILHCFPEGSVFYAHSGCVLVTAFLERYVNKTGK
jgi:hypothetical protein